MVNGKENFSLETVTFCPHPVAASLYTGRERRLLHSVRTQWPLRYTLGASGVNIGLLFAKENPVGLTISAVSVILDVTGVTDKIAKGIGNLFNF